MKTSRKFQTKACLALFASTSMMCGLGLSENARATDYTTTVYANDPTTILQGGDTITTSGFGYTGIYAASSRSLKVENGGITVTNLDFGGGSGLVNTISSSTVDLGTGTTLNVGGSGRPAGVIGPTGIFAQSNSTVKANDLTINASGDKPYGAYAYGATIRLTGTTNLNLAANITNDIAFGLVAMDGTLTAENADIHITGLNGKKVYYATSVKASRSSTVTVSGNLTADIEAQSFEGVAAGGQAGLRANITVHNVDIKGIASGSASSEALGYSLGYGTLTATGHTKFDLKADKHASGLEVYTDVIANLTGSSSFKIEAPNAYGISFIQTGGYGTVTASNVTMDIKGTTQAAVIFATTNTTAKVSITNGSLSSNMYGLLANGGHLETSLTNVTMTNDSGVAFQVQNNGSYLGKLDLTASGSTFTGTAATELGATSNITLNDSSTWNVTGHSVLTSLTNNNSTVAFSDPGAAPFRTLTVNNYSGNNGQLVLRTALGDDASPSDMLVIDGGTATGSTRVSVINAGGLGSLTTGDGILVISAVNGATTDATAFTQDGRIAAGAYDYTLVRGGSTSTENWYLTSAYVPPPTPEPTPNPGTGTEGETPQPNYRPEVPLAASLPPIATEYGYSVLGTLHERIGVSSRNAPQPAYEERIIRGRNGKQQVVRTPIAQAAVNNTKWFGGAWGRLIGDRGLRDNGSFAKNGPRYDYTFGGIQAGLDIYGRETEAGTDTAGIYVAYGDISANVKGAYGGKAGNIDMDAYTIGAYWTHKATQGWYTDAVIQGTWYSTSASSVYGQKLKPDGFGFIASMEAGYSFDLGNGLIMEPQAQLAYQTISFDNSSDAYGRFYFSNTDSLRGRIGARLAKTWSTDESTFQKVTLWARTNIWHEFMGDSKTTVTNLYGLNGVTVPSNLGGTWGEIGAGMTFQISDRLSLFASGAYNRSLDNKGRQSWNGNIGAVVRW